MFYNDFNKLFEDIILLKQKATTLNIYDRILFKKQFFKLSFPEWQLSLFWEFFWDDKSYEELYTIFTNKRLIKKEGDQLGKNRTKV